MGIDSLSLIADGWICGDAVEVDDMAHRRPVTGLDWGWVYRHFINGAHNLILPP